jgi:hypothetical protein
VTCTIVDYRVSHVRRCRLLLKKGIAFTQYQGVTRKREKIKEHSQGGVLSNLSQLLLLLSIHRLKGEGGCVVFSNSPLIKRMGFIHRLFTDSRDQLFSGIRALERNLAI